MKSTIPLGEMSGCRSIVGLSGAEPFNQLKSMKKHPVTMHLQPMRKLSIALALLGALLSAASALAAPITWNGGATPSPNWSDGGNWVGGIAPVAGDDVIFINGAADPLTSTVDSPLSVSGITRNPTGGSTVMTINTMGNLTLNGNILADTGGLTLAGPIALASDINIWRATAGTSGNVILTNAPGDVAGISGNQSVTFTNILGGSFFIFCNNPLSTWSGGSYVKYGNTRINGVSSSGSPGAPTAGPLGTGTVTLGSSGETNLAIVSWLGAANQTLHNNWVINSDGGGAAESRRLANNLTAPLKLTLSGGMTLNDDIYFAGTANNVTRLDGNLGGSGMLVLNLGNLSLLLAGNNSYGGGTRVVGDGFLGFGSDTALGTGLVTFGQAAGSGQVWSFALNGPRTIANDVRIQTARYIVAAGSMDGLAGNDQIFNGTVTMDHGSVNVRDIYLQKNLTLNGELKSANPDNALRITGGGKLTLTGVNSYQGGTFIATATLNINSDAALGADPGTPATNVTISGGGGTLQVGAPSVSLSANRNIVAEAGVPTVIGTLGNSLTINGVLTGGGSLQTVGTGTVTLKGTGNAISGYAYLDGNVIVDGGTLYEALELLVGWTAPGTATITGGGSLQTITVRPGANGTFNLNNGTVATDQIFALVPTTDNTIVNFDGGTVQPRGAQPARFSTYISGLTHAYLKAGGVTLDTLADTLTIPQPLEHDPALGATLDGGLAKSGSGDLILTGTNTYTGPTTVNSGRLIVSTTTGAKGAYSVMDGARLQVQRALVGSALTNTSLALGLFSGSALEINFSGLPLPATPPLRVTGALDPNGTTTVSVKGFPGGATPGVYPLIQYGSLGGIGFGSLFLDVIPNVTASLSNGVDSVIYLVVTDVDYPKWKGNLGNDWDIALTANWVSIATGTPTTYQEPSVPGAPVRFDDTADTGAVNLTIPLSPYSITVSNQSLSYTFSGLGNLAGPGSLTKLGGASLTLETANSYAGGNTLNGGTVMAAAPNALGSGGALTVNNAALNIGDFNQSVGTVALTNGTIAGTSGVLAATDYTLASGTISAHLANGNMAKVGSGTVSLTASNNYGATTISGGILRVTDASALAPGGFDAGRMTSIPTGGALEYDGNISTDEHISFMGSGPDGQGALRLVNGWLNHHMHIAMAGNATLKVGADSYLLHDQHLFTTGDAMTLTKTGAGQFWVMSYSYPQIAMDVTEGTLGAAGTVGGMVTVRTNATLAGLGVISGEVTVEAGGTLAPGTDVAGYEAYTMAPLTCASNLTLQGRTEMQISRNAGVTANDQVKGTSTLTMGGMLVVTNLGPDALAAGDTFQLFIAASYTDSFASVTLPPLDAGLAWADTLAANGTIQVVTQPVFSGVTRLADDNIQLAGTGPTNVGYRMFATTNVAEPFSNWVEVGSGTFTGGAFIFTDLQATNYPHRFYRVVTP
jgi:autotransporter-associated beta strand protein